MNARRNRFPFQSVPDMTPVQQIQGLYQVGFFADQIVDAFENVDNYTFNIACVQDLLDADIALTAAGAAAAIGGVTGALLGLGLAASWLNSSGAISIQGNTVRRACPQTNYATRNTKNPAGLPYKLCRDLCFQHIYASNLILLLVDWGATVKQLFGGKNGLSDFLFFPQITFFGFLGGYALSNDITLLQGAGTVTGGVLVDGSEGTISSVSALTSSGPPIGQPSLIGELSIGGRYDALKWSTVGGSLQLSGVPFTAIPGAPITPNAGIFFGDELSTFTPNSDGSISAVIPSGFKKDFLTFRASNGNLFTTRTPVSV